MDLIRIFLLAATLGLFAIPAYAAGLTQIGSVEDIVVLPCGARIPARVDTGAATSSLDVQNIRVEGKYVTFNLPQRCGGRQMRSRLVGMKTIRTSDGKSRRPVVKIDICIGSDIVRTNVTLNNRSKLEYPFLLGRRTLQGKFVVDVSRSNILPPTCQGVNPPPAANKE